MSTNTTTMAMGKAVDADNAKVYLETTLGAALDKVDASDHSGGVKGIAITGAHPGLTSLATSGTVTVGTHLIVSGPAVTAAAGAQAGGSPPAPVIGTSVDNGGLITFGTGSAPAAGELVTVTFGTTFVSPKAVVVCPANTATQALGLYVSNLATTGFALRATSGPAASQANTVYSFSYVTVG